MSSVLNHRQSLSRGRITACEPQDIASAAAALLAGDLVGMPTETVYGLAADATQGEAVAAIYEAKGRPAFNPLICHVAGLDQALRHGLFDNNALALAKAFWPGPLTLVVPFRPDSQVCDLARAGLDSIAIRVPDHPVARALLSLAQVPIAAPSANMSGRISPTRASDVIAELGEKVGMVLDAGPSQVGVESTIVSCLGGRISQLRPGGLARESIEAVLGHPLAVASDEKTLRSPGLLVSHYAPLAAMRMNVLDFAQNEAILAFGDIKLLNFHRLSPFVNLSPKADLRQAATRFFSSLRELDAYNPAAIAVAPIPMHGLGEAINDRLSRACAPRIS